MKDQLKHWNGIHSEQGLHEHSAHQTSFAEEVKTTIPPHSTILELGCGEGNDSIYFAEQGHDVIATDFSDVVIEQNAKRWPHSNLHFVVQDISQPFAQADNSVDVVYARLSLHYFSDEITRRIFREISRVLKPGGLLCFMCKSTTDGLYDRGTKIEDDMYELEGHVRHFFSEDYAKKLSELTGLTIESVVSGKDKLYDRQSAYMKVITRKNDHTR